MKKALYENLVIKNKCLIITLFLSFSLFAAESIFSKKYFKQEYITAEWEYALIKLSAVVYDYTDNNYGYLENCKFECIEQSKHHYTIMEIKTPIQKKDDETILILQNKLQDAIIYLFNYTKNRQELWPEKYKTTRHYMVPNLNEAAKASFKWSPVNEPSQIAFIRVTGIWKSRSGKEQFSFLINLNKNRPLKVIQSDKQKEITATIDSTEINPIEVYGESGAVIVKGTENGEVIKICNESGVEIKTVVANKSGSRFDLPTKQLYFIYIGQKKFKVAL